MPATRPEDMGPQSQQVLAVEEKTWFQFLRMRTRATLFSGCLSHNWKLCHMNSTSRAQFGLSYCQLNNDNFEPWHDRQAKWTCPTPEIRAVTLSHLLFHGTRGLGTARYWNFSHHFLGGRMFQAQTHLPNHSLLWSHCSFALAGQGGGGPK